MLRLRMPVLFLITIVSLTLVIAVLNWLPLAIEKDSVRRYGSMDDAKEKLKLERIFLPSYFPQYLKWPPSEIYAGGMPHPKLLMHFRHRDTGDIVLSISQRSQGDSELKSRIEPQKVKRTDSTFIKGRQARLDMAFCKDDEPCHKITWNEHGHVLTVIGKDSLDEVLKIAESMLSPE